jgi:hypothetical protein
MDADLPICAATPEGVAAHSAKNTSPVSRGAILPSEQRADWKYQVANDDVIDTIGVVGVRPRSGGFVGETET